MTSTGGAGNVGGCLRRAWNMLISSPHPDTRTVHNMKNIKSFLLGILFLSLVSVSFADERKAVIDLRSGDPEKIEVRLLGDLKYLSDYYAKQGHEFKAVVVISGKSYKYFIEDLANSPYKDEKELAAIQKTFRPLMQELHDDYGVRFEMCEVGMKARNIKAESLYPFVHSDKSQPVLLIDWQSAGYAYLPMN